MFFLKLHIPFYEADHAVEFLGVLFLGVHTEIVWKFLFTLIFVLVVVLLGRLLSFVTDWALRGQGNMRLEFLSRQARRLAVTLLLIVGVISIWFDDPTQLATALGLVTAGLSFALQKVITSIVGYFVILRGKVFQVGDRIVIGGGRDLKDTMSRDILEAFDKAGIGIASATFEIVGIPPLRLQRLPKENKGDQRQY